MPKYLATSSSYFRPFSYDELAKPLLQMQEAHNAAQEAYDTVALETNALAEYITQNPGDARARQMYNDYQTRLSTLQENLWKNGFTSQTRRDLSAARAGYASNISPLMTAIKNRSERSKEYWDARHKNPDLITGEDPGIGGLDNYIGNEEYGRNWYSYSGQQFATEVATDAKARAAEMLRMPGVMQTPGLPGTLTRIEKDGFTNAEVDAANRAVQAYYKGNTSALSDLDDASRILADAFINRVTATGAQGNVTPSEFERLLGYGSLGLSQAVGKTSGKDFEDPYFKQQMELDTYRRKMAMTPKSGSNNSGSDDGSPTTQIGWRHRYAWHTYRGADSDKNAAKLNRTFDEGFYDENGQPKPMRITTHDGETTWAYNKQDFGRYKDDTEYRRDVMDLMPGIDIAKEVSKKDDTWQTSDDGLFQVRKKGGKAVVYSRDNAEGNEPFEYDEAMTDLYNTALDKHNDAVKQFMKNNNASRKMVFDANDARKLRKEYPDLDLANVPDEDLEKVIQRMTVVDRRIETPPLVGPQKMYDDVREDYARLLNDYIIDHGGRANAKIFYPVLDGNYDYDKTPVSAEEAIDFDTNGLKPESLKSVTLLPEDVVVTKTGIPMVRIRAQRQVKKNGTYVDQSKPYLVPMEAFGSVYTNFVNSPLTEVLGIMLTPIMHADHVMGWSDAMSDEWANMLEESFYDDRLPADMQITFPSAKEIVRYDENWDQFYGMLCDIVASMTGREIDYSNNELIRKHPGLQSSTDAVNQRYIEQPKKKNNKKK